MAKEKLIDPLDRKFEAFVEKNRKKFQEEYGDSIHYTRDLGDNFPMEIFNQVMQEQAKKKVN